MPDLPITRSVRRAGGFVQTPKVPPIRFHEKSGYGRGPHHSSNDLRTRRVISAGCSSSVELHDALDALRAGDENAHAATEGISGDPGLVGH